MYDINLVSPYSQLSPEDYRIPLGICYLSSVLKESGYHVKAQDLSFQKIDWNTKVLGVSVNTFQFGEAKKIVQEAKNKGIITIAGGPHTKIDPESLINIGFDYVLIGEGEVTLPKILDKIIKHEVSENIIFGETVDLNTLPLPDFSWITNECHYANDVPFNTSRGCPYQCTFCSSVHGKKWRYMSPEKMLETYLYLTHFKKGIAFNDDAFSINIKRLEVFRDLVEKERIDKPPLILHSGIRVDHVSEEIMKILCSLNLTNVGLGMEHTNDTVLKLCKKGITFEDITKAIKILQKFGFARENTAFFLIMGLPGSSFQIDLEAKKWADKFPVYQSWCIATPFPTTELFNWVDENARWLVDPRDYENYAGLYSRGIVMFETSGYPKKHRELMWKIVKRSRI